MGRHSNRIVARIGIKTMPIRNTAYSTVFCIASFCVTISPNGDPIKYVESRGTTVKHLLKFPRPFLFFFTAVLWNRNCRNRNLLLSGTGTRMHYNSGSGPVQEPDLDPAGSKIKLNKKSQKM